MIYIKQETDLDVYKLDIPKEITIIENSYQLCLLNGQSKEILHITDLNNYSTSEYFVSIRIEATEINRLNKGYYSYVLKSDNNNIVACGLLVIEGENAVNTVYNNEIRNVVYNG